MISLLRRFFDDINRLANHITANPPKEVLVVLDSTDRAAILGALANFRRNKPRVKTNVLETK